MGYATTNPPNLTFSGALTRGNPASGTSEPSGINIWAYISADSAATVNGAGYFTNGDALGMKVGDIIFGRDTATPKTFQSYVSAVTAGGAASATQMVAPV